MDDTATSNATKYLKELSAFLKDGPPPLEESNEEDEGSSETNGTSDELERAKEDYTQMQEQFLKTLQLQEEKIAQTKQRILMLSQPSNTTIKPSTQSPPSPAPSIGGMKTVTSSLNSFMQNSPPQLFRLKDFKIQGISSNERNRLSFTSLQKQIDSAIEKGFPEGETVDAIINSVFPQLHLKSYLEGMKNLRLQELRQILRSHYCEKSAAEAYHDLTNIVQEANETPINFLMRALRIRQQILNASEEKQSRIKYDANLIHSAFINAVETGLADEAIRTRMRPYLEVPSVSDETLIREMNIAMTTENERSSKFGARRRPPKQNQISVLATEVVDKQTTKETKVNKKDTLLASLEAVQADVVMIKEAMKAQNPKTQGERGNR